MPYFLKENKVFEQIKKTIKNIAKIIIFESYIKNKLQLELVFKIIYIKYY